MTHDIDHFETLLQDILEKMVSFEVALSEQKTIVNNITDLSNALKNSDFRNTHTQKQIESTIKTLNDNFLKLEKKNDESNIVQQKLTSSLFKLIEIEKWKDELSRYITSEDIKEMKKAYFSLESLLKEVDALKQAVIKNCSSERLATLETEIDNIKVDLNKKSLLSGGAAGSVVGAIIALFKDVLKP